MNDQKFHRGPAFAVLVGGAFIGIMEQTVVVTALPRIGQAFPDSVAWLPWLLAASLTGAALAMPLGGYLADAWGARRTFALGVGLFAAGSLCSGLVGLALPAEVGVLLAARAVQGLGGGVFAPVALKVASAFFRREARTQAVGVAAAVGPLATIVGPLLGGYLVDNFAWQSIFLVNVPPMLLVGLLSLWLLPDPPSSRERRSDPLGMILLASAILAIVLALTLAGRSGLDSTGALSLGFMAVIFALLLVVVERRQEAPLLDGRVIGGAGTAAIFPLAFVQGVVAYSTVYFVSLYAQTHPSIQATATQAGLVLVAGAVGQMVVSPLAGKVVPRLGYRQAMATGTVVSAFPLLLLATEPLALAVLGLLVFVSRAGSALIRVPLAAAGLEAAEEQAGLISGLRQLSDVLGGVVGPVAFGAALGSGAHISGSYTSVFAAVGSLLLASLFLTARIPGLEAQISQRGRRDS